jgi:DNA-binding transcriptional LysR family regulator
VDLRQLAYFVAVVEANGFRPASRRLVVAQPALSSSVRRLELDLGVELLRRSSHGIEVTEAGRELLERARLLLRQAAEAREAIRECAQRQRRLRVGAVAGVLAASELTPPIFRDVRQTQPDLHVDFEELSFCDQVSPLLSGHFDVALVRDAVPHRELTVVPIASERRALLVGVEHELANEDEVGADDVLEQLMLPLGSPREWAGFWQLDDVRGGSHVHPEVAEATSVQNMQLAMASGEVMISVPEGMGRMAPHPLVRYVPLRDAPPSSIGVAWRRGDCRREISAFVEQVGRTAHEQIELLRGNAETSPPAYSAQRAIRAARR